MTEFNPENKQRLIFADVLNPAMTITQQHDADRYLASYVAHIQQDMDAQHRNDDISAERLARSNIAYYAGYFDNKTRERVERLFGCEHPVFGAIATNEPPTQKEAFEAGFNAARHNA